MGAQVILSGCLLLLLAQHLAANNDFTCVKGKVKKVFKLKEGETYSLSTAGDSGYNAKQKCNVIYKVNKCKKKKAVISCDDFNLGVVKRNCTRGDRIIIKPAKKPKQSFCGEDGPIDLEINKNFKVTFISDKKTTDDEVGFKCQVSCADDDDNGGGTTGSTTAAPTTTTTTASSGGATTGNVSYTQSYLKGPSDEAAHVHEGLQLEDGSGYVAVGHNQNSFVCTRVDNNGNKVWRVSFGSTQSMGQSILQVGDKIVLGGGVHDGTATKATLIILNVADGTTVKTTTAVHNDNGSIRGLAHKGSTIVGTGYVDNADGGFLFIADSDNAKAAVWKFDLDGNLVESKTLSPPGMTIKQGAKIRVDPGRGGYVIGSTAWSPTDDEQTVVVKLDDDLNIEWSQLYGVTTGLDQCFDILVDRDGNYLLGGHTNAVINWDYLAIKVDGNTKQELWRRTYGQPRGFDPKWIHDEMYGVALDSAGNYLLLGGSGDEYPYSAENAEGWSSDIWVSYLVVVSPSGETLFSGVFGSKGGNEAGEYLTYTKEGNIMIYTDSDTVPGMGFLLLTPN